MRRTTSGKWARPGPAARVRKSIMIWALKPPNPDARTNRSQALPSNEGRGYVLRKIMRRAMRHARMAGVEDPYLYQLTGFVADLMRPAYPELMETVQRVARVVKDEEHRYATTFLVAEKVFNDEVKSLGTSVLPGPVAFKLYDTSGLALDEQEDLARERGLEIDRAGFEEEMRHQRERARASWKGAAQAMV